MYTIVISCQEQQRISKTGLPGIARWATWRRILLPLLQIVNLANTLPPAPHCYSSAQMLLRRNFAFPTTWHQITVTSTGGSGFAPPTGIHLLAITSPCAPPLGYPPPSATYPCCLFQLPLPSCQPSPPPQPRPPPQLPPPPYHHLFFCKVCTQS